MARPKQDLKKVNLQMPRKEYELFCLYCQLKGWTMAGIMRGWLREYLIENAEDIRATLRAHREAQETVAHGQPTEQTNTG